MNKKFIILSISVLTIVSVFTYVTFKQKGKDIEKTDDLASERLKYLGIIEHKNDPVDPFNNKNWKKLVKEHKNSSCKNDFTRQCLLIEATQLLELDEGETRHSYIKYLAERALEGNDSKLAKQLLRVWPAPEDLEQQMKVGRDDDPYPPNTIAHVLKSYEINKTKLLFLVGNYDLGKKNLTKINNKYKTGEDYGSISVLINKGYLEQAYELSKMTLEWKREIPDPNLNSSAHMHCQNYSNPTPRVVSMGNLGAKYIENDNLERAYGLSKYIKQYWDSSAYGQSSYCYSEFARGSYMSLMTKLISVYHDKGDKLKTATLFDELKKEISSKIENIGCYDRFKFIQLATIAGQNGLKNELEDLAKTVENKTNAKGSSKCSSRSTEPLLLINTLIGQNDKAFHYLESKEYGLEEDEQGLLAKMIPANTSSDIILDNYLYAIKDLIKLKRNEDVRIFIEKMKPYLGKRTLKKYETHKNLDDLVTIGNAYLEIGDKEKSQELLKKALLELSKIEKNNIKGGIGKSFYGRLSLLYVQHEDIKKVQEWSNKLPLKYSGAYYSRIGKLLIDQSRWDEFDHYMDELSIALSADSGSISNWDWLIYELLNRGEYNRYFKIFNSVINTPDELKEKHKLKHVSRPKNSNPYSYQERYLVESFLVSELINPKAPQDMKDKFWSKRVQNCSAYKDRIKRYYVDYYRLADEKEVMATCYLIPIRLKEYYDSKSWRL